MNNNAIITLTTDFGSKDPFSAVMKGIIAGINPNARVLDITHEISKYNITEAALMLGMSYKYFPSGTIHVAVTDPGVGSERRPVIVTTGNYCFIGPDNGLFTMIYDENESFKVIHITARHYFLPDTSATFHGRDIFAPVAAWVSKGIDPSKFGDEIKDYIKLHLPAPSIAAAGKIEGEVVYIDHFGNAITNIRAKDLNTPPGKNPEISLKGNSISLKEYYSQAEDSGLYAIAGSTGYLELFVYRGNAAQDFSINAGDAVTVMLAQ